MNTLFFKKEATKRIYMNPSVQRITLDNEISLTMESISSMPPTLPTESLIMDNALDQPIGLL
jgi:hypothetical protein